MNVKLLSIGTASPAGHLEQKEAAKVAICCLGLSGDSARLVEILYRRTGVSTRGSVLLEQGQAAPNSNGLQNFYKARTDSMDYSGPATAARMAQYEAFAPSLAEAACRAALSHTGMPVNSMAPSLTHLVVVSCTGFFAPGLDYELINRLGLSPDIKRYCIGFMGCHGGFNGLQIAKSIAESDPSAQILLCSTELCSLHFQYSTDPGQITANALFADGAGAAIIGASPEAGLSIQALGSHLLGGGRDEMSWIIGDHGFRMHLSSKVPGLIRNRLRAWLEPWLLEQNLSLSEVSAWAVHPGGPRILRAVGEALELSDQALSPSFEVLRKHGNMSSATVWFIIEKLRQSGVKGPCVLLGFGPGLVVEAGLIIL